MFATNYNHVGNVIRVNYSIGGFLSAARAGGVFISTANTKLGQIPSFNTLPSNYIYIFNDLKIEGTCAQACPNCYGMKGNYNFSGALNNEVLNTILLRENIARVFSDIAAYVKREKPLYFRIHSNGDFLSVKEFMYWVELAEILPETTFYCYTKNYSWVSRALAKNPPKNFIVNISVFRGYGAREAFALQRQYKSNCNVFYAGESHLAINGVRVKRCGAYVRRVLKSGKLGGVTRLNSHTCDKCRMCMRANNIISTLEH